MRRISGVRDVERLLQLNMTLLNRPRTHRHFQIEGHQDRLERRAPQRIRPARTCATSAPARPAPARMARRRGSRRARADVAVSDVQAHAEDAERGAGGQLRHPHQLERRPLDRDLLVRAFREDLPLRGMPQIDPPPLPNFCGLLLLRSARHKADRATGCCSCACTSCFCAASIRSILRARSLSAATISRSFTKARTIRMLICMAVKA